MFGNNQNQGGGGGGLFGNQNKTGQQGGGLFGGNNQQQQGGGGGGGLFGGNNQQQQGGGGGGGLFGGNNQQQQGTGGGGGLFGNQNKTGQTGGGLFGNNQQQQGSTGGGLFGGNQQQQQQGGGGGLFGGNQQQQQQGGGLFNKPTGQTGGGLFSGQNTGGGQQGGLFGGQGGGQQGGGLFGGQQGTGGQFSLMQGKPGQQGGLFGAGDMSAMGTKNKYYLSLANSLRDKKVGSLNKLSQPVDAIGKVLDDNKAKIERLKVDNQELIQKKDALADNVYQFTQDTKQLYMKIRQARYLVDEMKSTLNTYEDITKSNFDHCLYLLKGGRPPNLEIPSPFMINITEYFDLRIRELKDKIEEIEELVKLTDLNEDSEDYEKIVIVLDELYNYYLNVAHKVFQLNEYIKDFKAQYIDYFKSQGSRDVEKIFVRAAPDAYKTEVLGRLETISNTILENKNKRLQEESKKVTTKLIN